MKTQFSNFPGGGRRVCVPFRGCLAAGRRACFALLAAASAPVAFAADSSTTASSKPYTLYMGSNVAVEWQGRLRPVQDVEGSTFVVDVDGRRVPVPTRFRDLKIKMDEALKVAPTGITITNFKPERAYSIENDPNRRYAEAVQNATGAAAVSDLQNAKLAQTQNMLAAAQMSGAPGDELEKLKMQVDQAGEQLQSDYFAQSAPINSVGDAGARVAEELARERFDAFRLTFEVSSPTPVAKPYMIVLTRYREDPAKPQTTRQWVYAQEMDPIGSRPRTVRLFRDGFPPGYKLEDVQFHLYDGGTELATNIARKRVEISADDAFQFAVVNYVEQHHGESLPPVPAESIAKVRSRLAADQQGRNYYLKIGKNGKPTGVFRDEDCNDKIADPELSAALLALRFNPALKSGKPVEGVARLSL